MTTWSVMVSAHLAESLCLSGTQLMLWSLCAETKELGFGGIQFIHLYRICSLFKGGPLPQILIHDSKSNLQEVFSLCFIWRRETGKFWIFVSFLFLWLLQFYNCKPFNSNNLFFQAFFRLSAGICVCEHVQVLTQIKCFTLDMGEWF